MAATEQQEEKQELVNAIVTKLQTILAELQEQERELAEVRGKPLPYTVPFSNERIELDVGGQRFTSSRLALCSSAGYFRTLLSGQVPVYKDQEGCLFVDRDPAYFRFILNFLRGQRAHELPNTEVLQEEAEFYEIAGFMESDTPQVAVGAQQPNASEIPRARQTPGLKEVDALLGKLDELAFEDLISLKAAKDTGPSGEIFQQTAEKIKKTHFPKKDKLNVGGKVFCTTMATLTSQEGYFQARFGGRFTSGDTDADDGAFFIDRDPAVFHLILRILRGQPLPRLSAEEHTLLEDDCAYYMLDCPFAPILSWRRGSSGHADGHVFHFPSSNFTACIALSVEEFPTTKSGVYTWGIQADSSCVVGVAPVDMTTICGVAVGGGDSFGGTPNFALKLAGIPLVATLVIKPKEDNFKPLGQPGNGLFGLGGAAAAAPAPVFGAQAAQPFGVQPFGLPAAPVPQASQHDAGFTATLSLAMEGKDLGDVVRLVVPAAWPTVCAAASGSMQSVRFVPVQ